MKLFKFRNDIKDSSGKCGYCNYETDRVMVLADREAEARELLREYRLAGGNGFCGDCMCNIIMEDEYLVLPFRTVKVALKEKEVKQILNGEIIVWADEMEDIHIKMEVKKNG